MAGLSRKGFLALAGTSAGALAVGCGGEDAEEKRREARTAADLAIVRFLLETERVGTAFWEQVVTRNAVDEVDAGGLARELARNERAHVEVLERYERRLGSKASKPPSTSFAKVFAAGPREVLRAGAELANLSSAAYLGQVNRIQDRNLLASVLAIHTVEGRHAAAIHRAAGELNAVFPGGAFAEPMAMAKVRSRVERLAS